MKVLFIIPRLRSMFGDRNIKSTYPHVGIAYLSSWLKKNNIKVEIFDDGIHLSRSKLINKVKSSDADLIATTMFSYCYKEGYDVIKTIKQNSSTHLVVGGPHVSSTRKQIMEETSADFAVKHEGEKTILELLKGKEHSSIPGLIWRNKKGKIVENKDRVFLSCDELNRMPFPDYESFDLKEYACYEERLLPIITSRGCPYACNYCSVKLSMGRNFRARSARNVFNEINHWYSKGFRVFDINDDCFTIDKKRVKDICDLIIKNELNLSFTLYNGIRANGLSKNLLKKMKKAGCKFISIGCESGNKEVLKKIKKSITKEQVSKASTWCEELNIDHSVNFIIGHTGETYEQALDSLKFAEELPANYCNFYNLVPYPGTEAYEWVMKHGNWLVDKDNYLKTVSYRDNSPIFETSEFTKEQREEIAKKGFDLYEKKLLNFRFGKGLGLIVYYITRNKLMHKIATGSLKNKFVVRLVQSVINRNK